MREGWVSTAGNRPLFAGVPSRSPAPRFGQRRAPFVLTVDLADDIGSRRWWRGLATLAALVGGLLFTAPGLDPLPAGASSPLAGSEIDEWRALGVGAPLAGSRSGIRMAPGARVEPIAQAPERAAIDLYLTLGREGVAPALVRAGASSADAAQAAALVRLAAPGLKAGTTAAVRLGRRDSTGRRPLDHFALRASLDLKLEIARGPAGLELRRIAVPLDTRPVRVRGVAGDSLYFALRTAGASPQVAADYLKAVQAEVDVGEISTQDRFDLVLSSRRSADGQSSDGMLLYAGLERMVGGKLQLVRWSSGGKPIWVNAATIGRPQQQSAGLQWPVAARITSTFGLRIHPILRFARMHRGIDFGASWGTPIHAAAEGQVTRAGWAGGYGRQVRIAHGGGLATSYSHLSSMVVAPGSLVQQGQLIGYVGSSGLSTGPHLHYEVFSGGIAVNPMTVRFARVQVADPGAVEAIKARLAWLLRTGSPARS